MSNDETVPIQTDDLTVESVLRHPIYDATGMMLLAGGSRVSAQVKEQLQNLKYPHSTSSPG